MKTSEFLRAAKAVIDTPEKWIKGDLARKADRTLACHPMSKEAVCFCMLGAQDRVYWEAVPGHTYDGVLVRTKDAAQHALQRALKAGGSWRSIPNFNDLRTTTHADVMAVYDAAIAERESQGD